MKIVVLRKKLFWYVVIRATNGQTIFTSETYYNKANAVRAAKVAADYIFQGRGQIEIIDKAKRNAN